MERVIVSAHDVDYLIKNVLGFDSSIQLGPTGRRYNWRGGDAIYEAQEHADFPFGEVIERANVLSEDDLAYAAEDGIRKWLLDNAAELQRQINDAAEEMRQELLESPLYWVVWGTETDQASAWINRGDALRDLKCHQEGFHIGDAFVHHPNARLVEGPTPELGATN